jgi:predicted O-methyltransferase YrrM
MFSLLLARDLDWYRIIETGTLRNPGNWKDGQSAVLFTEFVSAHGGSVASVDIDQQACAAARQAIADARFQVYCSDSVTWLQDQTDLDDVDLFYLDSWDVKWADDADSAEHHLREFRAIESYLKPGAIVAIDDNARFPDGRRTGKGRRIVEYLEQQGKSPIYDSYQIIYQF